jgi:thioredoxin
MAEAPATDDVTAPDELDALMAEDGGSVVLDFWSTTCGPCRAMAPDFAAVAEAHRDAPVRFCKIQTDAHPELAAAFRIRAVPTILFVHDGEILDAVVGRLDARRLDKKVRWLLSKARGEGVLARLFGGR